MLIKQELKTYRIDKQCDSCKKGVLIGTTVETYTTSENVKFIQHKCTNCGETLMIKGQKFPKLMHKAEGEVTEVTEEELNLKVEIFEEKKTVEPNEEDSVSLD